MITIKKSKLYLIAIYSLICLVLTGLEVLRASDLFWEFTQKFDPSHLLPAPCSKALIKTTEVLRLKASTPVVVNTIAGQLLDGWPMGAMEATPPTHPMFAIKNPEIVFLPEASRSPHLKNFLHIEVDPKNGFPSILEERRFETPMLFGFPSLPSWRVDIGKMGAQKAEKSFRARRKAHGLPELPVELYEINDDRKTHPYIETGAQGFITSAGLHSLEAIIANIELMAFHLHAVDDPADTYLAELLKSYPGLFSKSPPIYNSVSIYEILESLYPKGWRESFEEAVEKAAAVIPTFDKKTFLEYSTFMVRGGPLSHPDINRTWQNQNQHLMKEMALLKYPKNKHHSARRFIESEVPALNYSYLVKSLPGAIFSFYGKDFDPVLRDLVGIHQVTALLLVDFEREVQAGEMSRYDNLGAQDILWTNEGATQQIIRAVEAEEFQPWEVQAVYWEEVAYQDAYKKILLSMGLWRDQIHLTDRLKNYLIDKGLL